MYSYDRRQRIVVTGFGPYAEVVVNSSGIIAEALGGVVLPVISDAFSLLAPRLRPNDTVVSFGQAKTTVIRLEQIAHDASASLPTQLPLDAISRALTRERLPWELSSDAGDFVCNDLLFALLSRGYRAGLIHVPEMSPEWPADQLVLAGRTILSTLP